MYEPKWYRDKCKRNKFHFRTHESSAEAVEFLREEFGSKEDTPVLGEATAVIECPVCEVEDLTYCCSPGLPDNTCVFVCQSGHVFTNTVRHIREELFNIEPSQEAITHHRGLGRESPFSGE